jgi:hypothetical protein
MIRLRSPQVSAQKGFTPLILLIGILIFGISAMGGYYFFEQQIKTSPSIVNKTTTNDFTPETSLESSTSSEMANWKTYQNEKYGFSFDYPDKIFPYIKQVTGDDYLAFSRTDDLAFSGLTLTMQITPNQRSFSLKEVMDLYDKPGAEYRAKYGIHRVEQHIKIGDEEGYKVTVDSIEGNPGTEVTFGSSAYVLKNGNYIVLSLGSMNPETFKENAPLFDQIIASFKFTTI